MLRDNPRDYGYTCRSLLLVLFYISILRSLLIVSANFLSEEFSTNAPRDYQPECREFHRGSR